jgi:hypothetical protein
MSSIGIFMVSFFSILVGFLSAWIIRTKSIHKLKRDENRLNGLLESERLVKENLRRENQMAFQMKEKMELELSAKLREAALVIKEMDMDIILLQKSNEEVEAMFKAKDPEIFEVKKRLLEANNTISRLKGQLSNTKMPI